MLCSNSVWSPVGCHEDEGRLGRYGPHVNGAGEPGKLVGFANWAKTRGKGFGEQKRKRVGWAGVGLEQLGRTEES
jgi:hypothetical protein